MVGRLLAFSSYISEASSVHLVWMGLFSVMGFCHMLEASVLPSSSGVSGKPFERGWASLCGLLASSDGFWFLF